MSFNHQLARVHALVAPRVSPLSHPHPAYVLFFSVADRGPKQAIVVQASGASFDEAWESGAAQIDAARDAAGLRGEWLRVDWPDTVEALNWAAFQTRLSRTKRGYFRYGVALDAALSVAFLEQELNAHAMLYGGSDVAHAVLNVKNFEKYARARHPQADTRLASWADKPVYLLSARGVFSDAQGEAHVLAGPEGADAGRRVLGPMQAADVQALVVRGSDYLAGQVGLDGKFIYGWFPCFDRPIPAYNALRHASSTYAMVEAWEVTRSPALKSAIERALRYLITTLIRDARVPEGQAAFVVDTGDEIKLGANAVAILALTKYCEVTGERDYLPLLEKLALGIRAMQRAEDGGFVHVLHAADLSVKEPFRIIYYDGEAAFALMRLYGLTRDERWLATVERAFEYFIAQHHWRAHDHWLGYCVNELTQYRPEERYFRFGLQNVAGYLDFVLQRVTTFPTLLELMMAAHRMMARIATMPAMRHLLDEIDQEKFARALHHRANHLRNGHFWPELAMYYRNPGRIVGSFFIRHQAFRVRIDDVEHYLSGLCAYLADGVPGAQVALSDVAPAAVLVPGGAFRVAAQPAAPGNAGAAVAPARVRNAATTSNIGKPVRGWTAAELASLLDGEWLVEPPPDWHASDLSIMRGGEDIESPETLFIAIDEDTWHRGSGNRGVYAGWPDTHEALAALHGRCAGAIVQRHVPGLPADFPQLRVKDTYQTIGRLGEVARQRMQGQVVAITGTVGKSTVKGMLDDVLGQQGRVIATRGNHNTRTGVPLTLARAITDPDVCVLEVAMSALWMRSGGICQLARPHVAVVTEVGVGQVRPGLEDEAATARYKARVCQGLLPGGCALLNRDMAAFEIVRDEAIGYGARVVTYGFHAEADIRVLQYTPDPQGSDVVVQIGAQQLCYRVPVPGRAMVSNTLATLGAVQALERDVAAAAAQLAAYGTIHGRLETTEVALPSGGQVTLIDDSHNAEILSMKAAFEVAALHPAGAGRRRIAVLGRIINLGEQAPALHASLAEPLLATGFSRVFLHGEEMTHLAQRLPADLLGGCFQDAASLVQAVAAETVAGDTVLLKGSLRKSDFRRVPALLRAAWKQGKQAGLPAAPVRTVAASVAQTQGGRLILDLDQTEPLLADQADAPIAPGGFTQFLLLLLCCERLAQGKIKLDERVTVAEGSDAPGAAEPRIGLQRGHVLSVRELIGAVAVFNARDAAIVLAERLEGKSSQAVAALRTLTTSIGLTATTLRSVTGRNLPGQHTTLRDMARAVAHFVAVYPHRLHWLSASDGVWLGRLRRKPGNLVASGLAAWAFDGGGVSRNGFAVARVNGRDRLFCASGAHDSFNLDFRLRALMAQGGHQAPALAAQPVVPHALRPRAGDTVHVNLLGDTYFGEWYTRRRQARGIEDALTRRGYDHSFEGIRPLLDTGDFNIANFEAALSREPEGALRGRKPFVLVGDPQASVDALRRQGIHAVALGNNHAFDAGLNGLQETLQAFDGAGIARFGAGLDAQQAEAPLVLRVGGRTIKLYSAYWYRPYMEEDCAFYAMPDRPGAACLSGGLLDAIRAEKQRPDPATVVVLAHWGGDYTWTNGLQRRLAAQLLEAGADTIIGSGPHMLGEFDCQDGKWVAYSIGNGVFNSNGEYAQRGMPPFSFVAQLALGAGGDQLRLYPVFTDNTATFWQPRLVDDAQFQRVRDALAARGVAVLERAPVGGAQAAWCTRDDAGRWMIVLPLARTQGQVLENTLAQEARSGASAAIGQASLVQASGPVDISAAAATADARATAVVSQSGQITSVAADADLAPGSLYAPERLAAITGGEWMQPASTHATPGDAAHQVLAPQAPAVAADAAAAQDKTAPTADPINLAYLPKTWVPGSMAVVLERGSNFGFSPAQLARLGDEVAGAIGTSATPPVPGQPYLRVPNILQSMVDLAQYARRRHAGRIVAVTGSAGKSGSCDMLTHALVQLHGAPRVAASEKNENLILGVTRTLANLQGDEARVVLEIAAGHAARCAGIARPHVALFTNVSHAHLSYYGTVEAVADLKAALFDHLTVDGTAVVCRDTQLFDRVAERARRTGARLVTYGVHADADIRLLSYDLPSRTVRAQFFDETVTYVLGGEGEHLATNSLGVLACLHALGDDWRAAMAGLANWQPLEGRGNRFTVDVADGGQATIIDESFNAAPLSMRAALRLLAARPTDGRRVAVLGEMRELGDQATTLHTDMAAFLADLPIDRVHVMGTLYTDFWQQLPAAKRGIHAATLDELDEAVRADLRDGDLVLFKGSHSSDIYQAVARLRQALPEAA